jgi:hypothetical protein
LGSNRTPAITSGEEKAMTESKDNAEPSGASGGSHASEIGKDLKLLALSLGFAWPEDEAARWRVLKHMAGMAAHWRAKYSEVQVETWRDVERERMYQHMRRRAVSLAAKVTNLRRCLRDYMAGQRVAIAEARAELLAERGK